MANKSEKAGYVLKSIPIYIGLGIGYGVGGLTFCLCGLGAVIIAGCATAHKEWKEKGDEIFNRKSIEEVQKREEILDTIRQSLHKQYN